MDESSWAGRWRTLSDDVLTGMQDWRTAHPRATFAEIEAEVETQLSRLRARMLEDAALASRATDLGGAEASERWPCPECGAPLQARGQHTRTVTVRGNRTVPLRRTYGTCSACGTGLFPPG